MSGLGDFAKVIAEGKKAKKEAEEKSVSHQALKSLEESVKVNNPFRASVKIETRTEQVPITLHEEQPIQPAKITPDDYVGDWFELMWATDNVAMHIDAPAATAFCPATPSTILTVTQVSL